MPTIRSFRRSLTYELLGELFRCGAEDLQPIETHSDHICELYMIQNMLSNPNRGWQVHTVMYAYIGQHVEWLFYASKNDEMNPYLQRSVVQWREHRLASGYVVQNILNT